MTVPFVTPMQQFFDDNGDPLELGKLYTYIAGTTTPKATYTDDTGLFALPNPVELDAAGRAVIWVQGSYKYVLEDKLGNIIRTVDNVTAFNATAGAAPAYFESLSGNGVQTTFTLSQDLGTDEKAIMVFIDKGIPPCIANGTFDTDTIWTKGLGWSIAAGVATATGAISTAISQTAILTLIPGQAYAVTYTITASAGTLTPSVGGQNGTARNASGTYREVIVCGSTQTIAFTGAGFTGTLDNVSVTLADPAGFDIQPPTAYTLNGTSLTFAVAPPSGTNNIQVFAPSTLVAAASASAAAADASANAAALSEANAATSAAASAASAAAAASSAAAAAGLPVAVAGGTADAITATYAPAITPNDLTVIGFRASAANATNTPTFSPNGATARVITKQGGQALQPGDIPGAGFEALVAYNAANTRWELLNPCPKSIANQNGIINGGHLITNRYGGTTLTLNNTSGYSTDRWYATASGVIAQFTRGAYSTTCVSPTLLRVQRQVGQTSTGAIAISQIFESVNSWNYRGKKCVLRFRAAKGANFSGGTLQTLVITGTGTDQSAASLIGAAWTGYTVAASQLNTLTSTYDLFEMVVDMPSNETQIAIQFVWYGSGTAGANDYADITDIYFGLPAGSFVNDDIAILAEKCQRYYEIGGYSSNKIALGAVKTATAANWQSTPIVYATPKRTATPTVTLSGAVRKSGTVGSHTVTETAIASTSVAADSGWGFQIIDAATSATDNITGYSIDSWTSDAEL